NAWGLAALVPVDPEESYATGRGPALEGDWLAVVLPAKGVVHVFHRHHGGPEAWGLVNRLPLPDATGTGFFGGGLQLSGEVLAVTAFPHGQPPFVTLFQRTGEGAGSWSHRTTLAPFEGDTPVVMLHDDWLISISTAFFANGTLFQRPLEVRH